MHSPPSAVHRPWAAGFGPPVALQGAPTLFLRRGGVLRAGELKNIKEIKMLIAVCGLILIIF